MAFPKKITQVDSQTAECIENFVKHCDRVVADYWIRNNYKFAPPPIHKVEYCDKWAKVWRYEERGGELVKSSIFAFICIVDNETKALGLCKLGDIHKPAGCNTAAKTARGSIYQVDFNNCVGSNSIQYLRQ